MKASATIPSNPAPVKAFSGRVPVLVPAAESPWMRPVEIRRYLRCMREIRQYRDCGDFYYS
jgi:hypothetical protein